jgi:hypothetical protein
LIFWFIDSRQRCAECPGLIIVFSIHKLSSSVDVNPNLANVYHEIRYARKHENLLV